MNLQPILVESVSQATAQVFSTMLGVDIARGEVTAEEAPARCQYVRRS